MLNCLFAAGTKKACTICDVFRLTACRVYRSTIHASVSTSLDGYWHYIHVLYQQKFLDPTSLESQRNILVVLQVHLLKGLVGNAQYFPPVLSHGFINASPGADGINLHAAASQRGHRAAHAQLGDQIDRRRPSLQCILGQGR